MTEYIWIHKHLPGAITCWESWDYSVLKFSFSASWHVCDHAKLTQVNETSGSIYNPCSSWNCFSSMSFVAELLLWTFLVVGQTWIHCIIIYEASTFILSKEFLLYKCWLNNLALICKEENEEMGRKNGSVFHLLWRLLWGSRGAMGAQPCDVTACRAQLLTNGLWQGQLTKARGSAWILRTLSFSFLLSGRLLSAVWCKADWYMTWSLWEAGEMHTGASPPPPASLSYVTPWHTQPSLSLLPPFSTDGPSPTCEESEESYMRCISKQALPNFPMVLEGKFSISICKTNLIFSS